MGLVGSFSLAFLTAALFLRGADAKHCPAGWMNYKGNFYGVITQRQTWHEAEHHCRNQGRCCHLASILNGEEAEAVAKYIQHHPGKIGNLWIGLHDFYKNRRWLWSDCSKFSYTSWKAGEPNNANRNENCVELLSPGGYRQWNDWNCRMELASLCKCKRVMPLKLNC